MCFERDENGKFLNLFRLIGNETGNLKKKQRKIAQFQISAIKCTLKFVDKLSFRLVSHAFFHVFLPLISQGPMPPENAQHIFA